MQNQQYGSSSIMQEILLNGNIPVAGRNGMMAGGGGVIPPAMLDENRVPKFYHDAVIACGATNTNMPPNTALVYNMMVTSGLPRHILAHIWSTVNRTRPGQLTRAEFYSCLALIALAQKGESIASLSTLSQLPIPFLQASQIPVQQSSNVSSQQPSGSSRPAPAQKATSSASRFIPTSLLSRLRPEPKKEVDLIGDVVPTGKKEDSQPEPTEETPSGPNYDLSDIDWGSVGTSFGSELPDKTSIHCSAKLSNWEETVRAAAKLFKDCDMTIGKTKGDILTEVFETEKGAIYLRSLFAVNSILTRIQKAGGNSLPKEMSHDIRQCQQIWQKYAKFLRQMEKEENNPTLSSSLCPICQDIITSSAVEFGTRTYHSSCANLWVNCVRPVLP